MIIKTNNSIWAVGIGTARDSNLFCLPPPDPELDLGLWLMNLARNMILLKVDPGK